ncbi:MAG: class I SAM-dependent methyltransferase [Candidatus Nanopelagicales bacterium]
MPIPRDINPTSRWRADDYASHGRFVSAHGDVILRLLDPRPGERILDVGCGDGALTQRIVAMGAQVTGIDSSPELVAVAGAAGIDARVGDAQNMEFAGEFDAVFSNAALHWMLHPNAVARAMFIALRPGGRLAAEFGGFGNIAAIRTALTASLAGHGFDGADPGQYYPTVEQYHGVLAGAGFIDIDAELVPRQTLLPGDMADWLRTFRQGFLDSLDVPAEVQRTVISDTCGLLAPVLHDATTDRWYADYVRLRVIARRPEDA